MTSPIKDKDYLIKFLLDKTVDLGARDDCAMDLADYETEDVFAALYKCASDKSENEVIQGSCGESLAEIMVRTNIFRKEYSVDLSEHADAEFKAFIKNKKQEWLNKINS